MFKCTMKSASSLVKNRQRNDVMLILTQKHLGPIRKLYSMQLDILSTVAMWSFPRDWLVDITNS